MEKRTKIALIGAGGASFGSLSAYEAVREEGLRGCELMLIDISQERLDITVRAANKLNETHNSPLIITSSTNLEEGIKNSDFVIVSVEAGRWKYWKQDLEIPKRHGSLQDMGECGGPGGLFHALRTIPLVLGICKVIEKVVPAALVINVTNPLPRVNMAIHRATKLNCIGMCPENTLAKIRHSLKLHTKPSDIEIEASGLNHFTWITGIKKISTDQDLLPSLLNNLRKYPFLYPKLVRKCYRDFGIFPVCEDTHIGEYLPSEGPGSRTVPPKWIPYQALSAFECSYRIKFTKFYGSSNLKIPIDVLPHSIEGVMKIIGALITKNNLHVDAVNVLNKGYIPNLPEWAVVEVPADIHNGTIVPKKMPAFRGELARIMKEQCEIQSLIVDSVLERDKSLVLKALEKDPLAPPNKISCINTLDEIIQLQKEALPFD